MIVILTTDDINKNMSHAGTTLSQNGLLCASREIINEADYVLGIENGRYYFLKNRSEIVSKKGEPLSNFMSFILDTLPNGG
ncbi:MAG: hypothetical protein WC375_09065 [Methanomassiliicoccales archaeon]|jgi:hypothetical protein